MSIMSGWVAPVLLALCMSLAVADELPWWKTAILYQVYPRSFKDSDGDGIGDLKGIIEKVDYLKEIGVEAIWMNPIFPSPLVDFGYDVSNYTDIDPMFGSLDDMKELLKVYENHGIKVLLDFVPNHSSDQHPWFQKSIKKIDPYTDYYIWKNGTYDSKTGNRTPPNTWINRFKGSAWEWNEERQQYYFHLFTKAQPDFNVRNPKVLAELENIIRFWLDLNLDGLRIDAPIFLYETTNLSIVEPLFPGKSGSDWFDYDHTCRENLPETFDLVRRWGEIAYEYSSRPGGKPRVMFAEAYATINNTMQYFGKNASIPLAPFSFQILVTGDKPTRASTMKEAVDSWMRYLPKGASTPWVGSNHDRKRIPELFGSEMADSMNLLIGTLPGLQCVYYGDELGMQNTFVRWDETQDTTALDMGEDKYITMTRDPERTPMQWDDSSPSAGFSTNSTPWLPVNPNYWWLNVEAQRAAQKSHLKVFQAMAKARKDPVLQRGDLNVIVPDNDTLLIVRSFNGSSFILVANWGSQVRNHTSQNLFAPNNLDLDMEVVIVSVNYHGHNVGDLLYSKSLNLRMRPKSSILLKTVKTTPSPSSATGLTSNFFGLLFICSFFVVCLSS